MGVNSITTRWRIFPVCYEFLLTDVAPNIIGFYLGCYLLFYYCLLFTQFNRQFRM